MSEIGKLAFKGAAIGGGAGLVTGAIVGGIEANNQIKKVPLESIEVPEQQRPVYEEKYIGTETDTHINYENPLLSYTRTNNEYAKFPVRNPDGSIKMETVPARVETGHGKPYIETTQKNITEPTNIRVSSSSWTETDTKTDPYGNTQEYITGQYLDQEIYYDNKIVGNYTLKEAEFVHGVNVGGIVMKNIGIFTGIGVGVGAIAGAIYAAVAKS